MEPEKLENNIKKVLSEREIQPSSGSWETLEQRLEKKEEKRRPYLLWLTSAAAIAAVFFILGTFFNAPIASEEPQVVEQAPEHQILKEKIAEPEVIQLAISEGEAEGEKAQTTKMSSAERPAGNVISDTPVGNTSEEEKLFASGITSEAPEAAIPETNLLAEHQPQKTKGGASLMDNDIETEALLLLATAELESDPAYTVDSKDLLHQVEYELDQSFRQKVFEAVKEGFSKAKTAVANRDF